MEIERLLRKVDLTPSRLSYKPWFKHLVDAADVVPRAMFPGYFSRLPPAHMRVRVGVGREIFNNHVNHLHGVRVWWLFLLNKGYIKMDSDILDLGSGCGRYAQYLRDYECYGDRYRGHYWGIDIDQEMVDWCSGHFDPDRFTFIANPQGYRGADTPLENWPLPLLPGCVDLVYSMSLYTHLLQHDVEHYTRESFRVLRPGGICTATFFSIDAPPQFRGITFPHREGVAFVESKDHPANNVAYEERYMRALFAEAGFEAVDILRDGQSLIIGHKPA